MILPDHTTHDSQSYGAYRAASMRRRTGVDFLAVCRSATATSCFFPPIAMAGPTKPEKVFRSAGVSASVFRNTTDTKEGESTFYKVALTRSYRDGNEYKSTASLGRDDLPVATLLLERAWTYIVDVESQRDK